MGFSYGDGNHEEIGKIALLNLNLAEVRGGTRWWSRKTTKPRILSTLVEELLHLSNVLVHVPRAMMTAISDKIRSVDQVFVVGQKILDMDALGSAVGMQLFASNIIENSYAVYDAEHMPADIKRAIQFLKKEDVTETFISYRCDEVGYKPFIIDSGGSFQDGFDFVKDFYDLFLKLLLLTIIDVIRISLRMQSSPILKVGQVVPVSWSGN